MLNIILFQTHRFTLFDLCILQLDTHTYTLCILQLDTHTYTLCILQLDTHTYTLCTGVCCLCLQYLTYLTPDDL